MVLSLILTSLVALAAFFYIVAPLRRTAAPVAVAATPQRPDRKALIEQRDALLRDLKDLEFEHQMGKIDSEDYQTLQTTLSERTAEVLRRLEVTRGSGGEFQQWRMRLWDLEAEAEILIARTRHKLTANGVSLNDAPKLWTCAHCGRVMGEADRFCASCGAARG